MQHWTYQIPGAKPLICLGVIGMPMCHRDFRDVTCSDLGDVWGSALHAIEQPAYLVTEWKPPVHERVCRSEICDSCTVIVQGQEPVLDELVHTPTVCATVSNAGRNVVYIVEGFRWVVAPDIRPPMTRARISLSQQDNPTRAGLPLFDIGVRTEGGPFV